MDDTMITSGAVEMTSAFARARVAWLQTTIRRLLAHTVAPVQGRTVPFAGDKTTLSTDVVYSRSGRPPV